jgi:hypothetical protein
MDIVSIPRRGYLDSSLIDDIRFYERFLAMIVAKMNVDRIARNICFNEKSKIKEYQIYLNMMKKSNKKMPSNGRIKGETYRLVFR